MVVKIFWQENCARCPPAKELGEELKNKGFPVEYHDVKSGQGLAQAIYHDVLSTPSVIVLNEFNKEVAAWRNDTPTMDEVIRFV